MKLFAHITWVFAAAAAVGLAVCYAVTGPAWAAAVAAVWATFNVGLALCYFILGTSNDRG